MDVYILITLLTVAAMYDLNYAKIPNQIIVIGLSLALTECLFNKGIDGVRECFVGMCIPFLTGMVVYVFGVLGAGDIKLFCVIGAFLGVRVVLGSIGYAFLFGTIEGGIKLLYTGRWRRFPNKEVTIRFALPILLGTLGELIL